MSNFRPSDRETGFLMPPSVDEWLPERHLARFVVEVVDGLELRAMSQSYRGSGSASYHPTVLLSILIYGYATGVFSGRKLERATYDSVAFRFIAGNEHPDHDTIATFRRRFLTQIEGLFVEVLKLAREMGVLQLGTVALDGTKVHANASRHSALSYEHAGKIEAQLKAEVADLLAKAEAADQADVPDGMTIPDELARRQARLAKLAEARAKIEARAKERFEREQAEHQAKLAERAAKAAATGKKPSGKPPQPPVEGPLPTDQINLTDEESRIMPPAFALGDSHISKYPVESMGCRHGPKHILTAPLVRWVEGVQAETCIFPMLANSCSGPDITCAHTLVRRRGSMPISETITCAVRSLTPGTLRSRRTASRKGSRSWPIASSISAVAASRASIWRRCG